MKDAQGSASGWELSIVFEMPLGQKDPGVHRGNGA